LAATPLCGRGTAVPCISMIRMAVHGITSNLGDSLHCTYGCATLGCFKPWPLSAPALTFRTKKLIHILPASANFAELNGPCHSQELSCLPRARRPHKPRIQQTPFSFYLNSSTSSEASWPHPCPFIGTGARAHLCAPPPSALHIRDEAVISQYAPGIVPYLAGAPT